MDLPSQASHDHVYGGVHYSEAEEALDRFADVSGIPVGETMAQGSLRYDHPLCLGAVGATGTLAANRIAKEADLIIGVGTRYSDFTTSSKTQPNTRTCASSSTWSPDAHKHNATP